MHFLIDYENVHNAGLMGAGYLNEEDHVHLFYSQCSMTMERGYMQMLEQCGCAFEIIKLITAGKNFLDFYIAVKLGEIVASGCQKPIAIISKDQGYKAVQEYCGRYTALHKKLVLKPNIAEGILAAKEGTERMQMLQQEKEHISIETEYALYQERMKLREELEQLFSNTEYEQDMDKAFCILQRKEGRKNVYVSMLKTFGREHGVEVYNMTREIIA